MNCRAVESRLSAYLDGELSGHDMFCIRDHLRLCETCRFEAESLKGLKRLIGSIECPEPSRDFEARLAARVMGQVKPEPTIGGAKSALLFVSVAGLTMAATLQMLGMLTPTPSTASRTSPGMTRPGIDFEVNRDAMTSAISDPISGAPAWPAVDSR